MLIDAREVPADTTVSADVCVVGGGAAGITLARELAGKRRRVVLLESGGFKYEEETQALYDGPVGGTVLKAQDNYLKGSRLRFLGGSTNHWDGWCRPLDPLDFEARDWVPMSGWPIPRADLDPYYTRACAHLQIRPFDFGPADLYHGYDGYLFPQNGPLPTSLFHISPPTRFGEVYREALVQSPDIHVYTWANVVELETNAAGTALEQVRAATLSGRRFAVKARHYVLAAGGIENARLLLASNRVQKAGLGNHNDMVGRCFMEHPSFQPVGYMAVLRRHKKLRSYEVRRYEKFGQQRIQGVVVTAPETQRKHRLLNTLFSPHVNPAPKLAGEVNEIAMALDQMTTQASPPAPEASFYGSVAIVVEQAPNRESRVTLAEERDALGIPRVRLDWMLGEIDRVSLRTSIELFARELGALGIGRGFFNIDPEKPWRRITTSAHHMGTTRMTADPKLGVVDPSLRIHGMENVFVASSSVFPTCGVSNPTLTIVALTVRLADHLEKSLG